MCSDEEFTDEALSGCVTWIEAELEQTYTLLEFEIVLTSVGTVLCAARLNGVTAFIEAESARSFPWHL